MLPGVVWLTVTTRRRIISQKSAYLINIAAETWNQRTEVFGMEVTPTRCCQCICEFAFPYYLLVTGSMWSGEWPGFYFHFRPLDKETSIAVLCTISWRHTGGDTFLISAPYAWSASRSGWLYRCFGLVSDLDVTLNWTVAYLISSVFTRQQWLDGKYRAIKDFL
jgi:hypothetical protein